MGRYTTVQTYTDQDAKVAAISYSTATTPGGDAAAPVASAASLDAADGGEPAATATATTDEGAGQRFHINRVDNVAGSTAGAGSGEFHMYRAARRREMERVARMEKQHEAKTLQDEFERARKRKAQELEERASKRADKRRRRKERRKTRELDEEEEESKNKEKEKDEEPVPETPGGVPAIPNDGSFLAKMLALRGSGGAKEGAEGEDSKPSKRR